LNDPERIANEILQAIGRKSGKKVAVMIVDSDKTYSFKGLHITPRPRPIKGIKCLGLLAYIIGRALKWKPRSTPLAIAGCNMSVEEALRIAAIANKARGHGAGRTAWDMAERFNVGLGEVTWEMLEKVKHHPIVVVRMKTDSVKQLKR
jgi:F420-0:gamma-glutamyl ligase-like protein